MAVFLGPEYVSRQIRDDPSGERHAIKLGKKIDGGIWDYRTGYSLGVDSSLDPQFDEEYRLDNLYHEIKNSSADRDEFFENCAKHLDRELDMSYIAAEGRVDDDVHLEAQEVLEEGSAVCNEYGLLAAAMVEKACYDFLPGAPALNAAVVIHDWETAEQVIAEEDLSRIPRELVEQEPEIDTLGFSDDEIPIHLWAEHVREKRTVIDPAHGNVGQPSDFDVFSGYLSDFEWF